MLCRPAVKLRTAWLIAMTSIVFASQAQAVLQTFFEVDPTAGIRTQPWVVDQLGQCSMDMLVSDLITLLAAGDPVLEQNYINAVLTDPDLELTDIVDVCFNGGFLGVPVAVPNAFWLSAQINIPAGQQKCKVTTKTTTFTAPGVSQAGRINWRRGFRDAKDKGRAAVEKWQNKAPKKYLVGFKSDTMIEMQEFTIPTNVTTIDYWLHQWAPGLISSATAISFAKIECDDVFDPNPPELIDPADTVQLAESVSRDYLLTDVVAQMDQTIPALLTTLDPLQRNQEIADLFVSLEDPPISSNFSGTVKEAAFSELDALVDTSFPINPCNIPATLAARDAIEIDSAFDHAVPALSPLALGVLVGLLMISAMPTLLRRS